MGNVITIDDGIKTYDIANKEGEILSSFSFNPSDTNIVDRYEKAVEKLAEFIPSIQSAEKEVELFKELDAEVSKIIDGIFNSNISERFFCIMGPFSPMEDGRFFLEVALESVGKVIESEIGKRVSKMNSKIQKHTSKYHG